MIQLIAAAGRKNNRLIFLASAVGIPRIMVSHSISRLPPPIPNPVRNPSRVPTRIITGNVSNINTGSLPIES